MMNRTLSSLLLAALPFAASASLIDFDNSPGGLISSGTVITSQYAPLGVTFSALEEGSLVDAWAVTQAAATVPGIGHSGNSLWNCNVGCGPRADIIRISFAIPVDSVSWYTDSEGNALITFNAYDASDTLLETVSMSSVFPAFALTGFTVGGISRIDALQPNDGWGWSMDNLSFTARGGNVPEPGSLALVVLSLGIAGLARARRKTQA